MDNAQNFAQFIERERERLNGERTKIDEQITALTEQRTGLDRELAAIAAYETAKSGVTPQRGKSGNRRQGQQAQATRMRRGSKREELLNLIRSTPNGLKRGDILERMGLKGDKAGEMSVSNALTALTKNGTVSRHDGKYVPGSAAA